MNSKKAKTIFLVEDNPIVLEFVKEILSMHGYNVVSSSDSYDALQTFDKIYSSVDILLTDIVMPNMNGEELYCKLKEKNRKLKALFMSGYPRESLSEFVSDEKKLNLINKPFSNNSLLDKIRGILDEAEEANGKHLT